MYNNSGRDRMEQDSRPFDDWINALHHFHTKTDSFRLDDTLCWNWQRGYSSVNAENNVDNIQGHFFCPCGQGSFNGTHFTYFLDIHRGWVLNENANQLKVNGDWLSVSTFVELLLLDLFEMSVNFPFNRSDPVLAFMKRLNLLAHRSTKATAIELTTISFGTVYRNWTIGRRDDYDLGTQQRTCCKSTIYWTKIESVSS